MWPLVKEVPPQVPGQGEDMPSNGAADRGDLARLALKVAEELDRTLHGEAANAGVIDEFRMCLESGGGAPSPARSMFLHNHRTIGAFTRAWQRAYNTRLETIEDLNARVPEKVHEAARLLARQTGEGDSEKEDMKRFFLSLHRELLMQQFPPRRIRRSRLPQELTDG